jgi:hypothetical protein
MRGGAVHAKNTRKIAQRDLHSRRTLPCATTHKHCPCPTKNTVTSWHASACSAAPIRVDTLRQQEVLLSGHPTQQTHPSSCRPVLRLSLAACCHAVQICATQCHELFLNWRPTQQHAILLKMTAHSLPCVYAVICTAGSPLPPLVLLSSSTTLHHVGCLQVGQQHGWPLFGMLAASR